MSYYTGSNGRCSTTDHICSIPASYNANTTLTLAKYVFTAGLPELSEHNDGNGGHTAPSYSRPIQYRLAGSALPWTSINVVLLGVFSYPGSLEISYPPYDPLVRGCSCSWLASCVTDCWCQWQRLLAERCACLFVVLCLLALPLFPLLSTSFVTLPAATRSRPSRSAPRCPPPRTSPCSRKTTCRMWSRSQLPQSDAKRCKATRHQAGERARSVRARHPAATAALTGDLHGVCRAAVVDEVSTTCEGLGVEQCEQVREGGARHRNARRLLPVRRMW